jgi:hypothetical protein
MEEEEEEEECHGPHRGRSGDSARQTAPLAFAAEPLQAGQVREMPLRRGVE